MAKGIVQTEIPGIYQMPCGSYVIDCFVKGQRIYHNFRNRSCDIGLKTVTDEMTVRKAEAILGRSRQAEKQRSLTIRQALEFYWENKAKLLGSHVSVKSLLTMLDAKLGHLLARNLIMADLNNYVRARKHDVTRFKRPPSLRTIEAELDQLSIAMNWTKRNRLLVETPIPEGWKKEIRVSFPRDTQQPHVLDEGEMNGKQWQALLAHAHPDLHAPLLLMYETGMRRNEILNLRWDWVEVDSRRIHLPGWYDGGMITKSRRSREIPLSTMALAAISLTIGDRRIGSQWVFWRANGRRLRSLNKLFRLARMRAELPAWVTPHSLRRTRATIWNALDEPAAMRALGHEDTRVHRRHYLLVSDKRLDDMAGLGKSAGMLYRAACN
jgi:integrase